MKLGMIICVLLVVAGAAFLQFRGGDSQVGGMSIRQVNDTKVVLSGWPRKHGDTKVDKGACSLSVTPTSNAQLHFVGSTIIPWAGGVGFQTNGDLGDGGMALVDAGNCRWTFTESGPFEIGDVVVVASKGATVEFDLNGQIITRGLDFKKKN